MAHCANLVPAALTTLAGGQANSDWEDLPLAILGLSSFLASGSDGEPERREASFVMFRCGTVARVRPADPEFSGYPESEYVFPEHRAHDALTVEDVTDDNARVWEAQRALPEPAGRAVRQAYAVIAAQGYPYPGGPDSDRAAAVLGCAAESEEALICVCWPNLDPDLRMFNLAVARRGAGLAADAGVGLAVSAAGELRRCDYMFPEAVVVITPDGALWAYRDAAAHLWTRPPPDGRALQFSPGTGQELQPEP